MISAKDSSKYRSPGVALFRDSFGSSTKASGKVITKPLSLPDKPSIAVLPFQNMSGDPEQEYFADGMVEDIITALSRFGELFVIARNSTFTYKGKAVDIGQVGRELGVRYVLEGSVRKAGDRIGIIGQLIDAGSGSHLWADRFDGDVQDIFDLQDQVTSRVVNAIARKIEEVEINRAAHKPTENLDAYNCYLRGLAAYYKFSRDAIDEALRYFLKAIQLDPDFALAYGLASICYNHRGVRGWMVDVPKEIADATRLARRAAELGKNDATALFTAISSRADTVRPPSGRKDRSKSRLKRKRCGSWCEQCAGRTTRRGPRRGRQIDTTQSCAARLGDQENNPNSPR
jgi:TolB-like protein